MMWTGKFWSFSVSESVSHKAVTEWQFRWTAINSWELPCSGRGSSSLKAPCIWFSNLSVCLNSRLVNIRAGKIVCFCAHTHAYHLIGSWELNPSSCKCSQSAVQIGGVSSAHPLWRFPCWFRSLLPLKQQSSWSSSLPWQSSAVAQLSAILGFTILQILLLPKLWGPADHSDSRFMKHLWLPWASPEPSLLTKLALCLFRVDPIFWNSKASPASFTKQGGKWKTRVSPSQGKGLYSASHPILRWCHPVLGLECLGGNMHLSTIPHARCYNFVSLTTAGSRGEKKITEVLSCCLCTSFFPEPIPAGHL